MACASDIYPYIYNFLVTSGHTKTAKLFLKEANITIDDKVSKINLLDMFKDYIKPTVSKDSDSSSVSDSNSDSDSSDSDSDEEVAKPTAVTADSSSSESESSDSDSSDSDSDSDSDEVVAKPTAVTADSSSSESESGDSDSSDSDSDSDSDEGVPLQRTKRSRENGESADGAASKKMKVDSSSESSSSGSDDSDDSESSSDEESDDEETVARKLKQREMERKEKARQAAAAAAAWMEKAPTNSGSKSAPNSAAKSPGVPFKRVNSEIWGSQIIAGLEDNSYEKAFGDDGYGAKASNVLMQVRGKDFRHEKTKKKRGSYRGGSITLNSNSFKYEE